ncbi:MAG: cell division protein ZapA, partial [Arenicellales bacterium]
DYTVACPEEKREELIATAAYLDKNMREIQQSGAVLGTERVAVMAALNIAHDLLSLRENTGLTVEMETRIKNLRRNLEEALDGQAEMEL